MCADGAQQGRDDKRRLKRACFFCCCGCGCFPPPQHNHHFQADWLYNIPRRRLSVLFHPFCGSADYKQSGRLRASGRTALRESLMRSRFKHWPFLKLQWISEISSGISHGDTNDQRSELAPVLIISRGRGGGAEIRIYNKRALFDE